jgi:hypothetical protein
MLDDLNEKSKFVTKQINGITSLYLQQNIEDCVNKKNNKLVVVVVIVAAMNQLGNAFNQNKHTRVICICPRP